MGFCVFNLVFRLWPWPVWLNQTFHEHFIGVWRPLILLSCAPFSRVVSYYIILSIIRVRRPCDSFFAELLKTWPPTLLSFSRARTVIDRRRRRRWRWRMTRRRRRHAAEGTNTHSRARALSTKNGLWSSARRGEKRAARKTSSRRKWTVATYTFCSIHPISTLTVIDGRYVVITF